MATEDPWDAPDPTKLRISAVPAPRTERRPPRATSRETPAAPPPHHASPTLEHGVVDEAAVEAPPIPRPEQPRSPKPAMIDTRVSQGQTPVMVDGLEGVRWRDVDDASNAPRPPAVRPWARHAAMTLGAFATLTIFAAILYVLGMGAYRAIQESDPDRVDAPVRAPAAPAPADPETFKDPPPTSIIGEEEIPVAPIELPPQVDPYDGEEITDDGSEDDE